MITYRVHTYSQILVPIKTVWRTDTDKQFENFCKQFGFKEEEDGVYRTEFDELGIQSYIEIKKEDNDTHTG